MIIPGLACPKCGSENLRRSKRQSLAEIGNMLFGAYPFRCLECGTRSWISVWMFSKLGTAKCPKCLRSNLLAWPEKFYRPTLWRRVQFTLGAHRYRCEACRYNFVSFRPRIAGARAGAAEPTAEQRSVRNSSFPD